MSLAARAKVSPSSVASHGELLLDGGQLDRALAGEDAVVGEGELDGQPVDDRRLAGLVGVGDGIGREVDGGLGDQVVPEPAFPAGELVAAAGGVPLDRAAKARPSAARRSGRAASPSAMSSPRARSGSMMGQTAR
ncbi:hypothetical protein [Glycomyces tenuis]|uniref:hypothetical protein n=1 Tax=Glycomyces tenuis TaxID=58116 RepID=UPI000479F161|nr:hypothetical protein [Glycomyces tenuis]